MQGFSRSLPKSVIDLVRWVDSSAIPPMAADRVPGAAGPELRRLAALGALARELAPSAIDNWPESLASWARDAEVVVDDEIIKSIRMALPIHGSDVLALAYEQIVSGPNRRQLGTFFTPAPIVHYMVDQAKHLMPVTPRSVADPGAGVGAFTLAALETWKDALVAAVDVNVVTLGLLAARATASTDQSPDSSNRLKLVPGDYLGWIRDEWPSYHGPRLILGNPPYTRHQKICLKDKSAARKAAGSLITSGLAGLSAYFLAASIKALEADDAACFLLPSSWCETRYGREIREWLWGAKKRRVEVQFFPSKIDVFPGTKVAAMVLLIGPSRDSDQPFMAREIDLDHNAADREKVSIGRTIDGCRDKNCPATFTELLHRPVRRKSMPSIRLEEAADIRRGVATGANSFFFVADSIKEKYGLPCEVLRPALMKPAHCTESRFNEYVHQAMADADIPRWLLDLNGMDSVAENEGIQKYLSYGKALGVDGRYLSMHRPKWYVVEHVGSPDLFLVPVGKVHRVIVNEVGAVGSNNLYGIYLHDDAPWGKDELASWLRSREGARSLADLARHYHGGSLKIEPGALRNLNVPLNITG